MITLTARAWCRAADCDWAEAGDPDGTDRAADKHHDKTRHPVATVVTPNHSNH